MHIVKKRGELCVRPGSVGSRPYLEACVFVRVFMYKQTNERRLCANIAGDIPHLIKSSWDFVPGRMEVIETYPATGEFFCRESDFEAVCRYIRGVAEVRDIKIMHRYPAVAREPELTCENVAITDDTCEEMRRVATGAINADADIVIFKFYRVPRGINFRKLVPDAYAYADGRDHTYREPLHIGAYATYQSAHSSFQAFFYSRAIIDRTGLTLPGSFAHKIEMDIPE